MGSSLAMAPLHESEKNYLSSIISQQFKFMQIRLTILLDIYDIEIKRFQLTSDKPSEGLQLIILLILRPISFLRSHGSFTGICLRKVKFRTTQRAFNLISLASIKHLTIYEFKDIGI